MSLSTIINGYVISLNIRNFSADEMSLAFQQALSQYRDMRNPVYRDQVAEIYLGNPGDTNYEDRTFTALYLGTSGNAFGDACHFWFVPDRNLVCVTYGSDSGRTTWGRHIGDGPVETRVSPEQQLLLNTAIANAEIRRASRDQLQAYYNFQHE